MEKEFTISIYWQISVFMSFRENFRLFLHFLLNKSFKKCSSFCLSVGLKCHCSCNKQIILSAYFRLSKGLSSHIGLEWPAGDLHIFFLENWKWGVGFCRWSRNRFKWKHKITERVSIQIWFFLRLCKNIDKYHSKLVYNTT